MNWQEKAEETQATIDMIKGSLEKAITTSTGLSGYDLAAPALEIYPVLSPVRNRLPRKKAVQGSEAANWKQITGVNAATRPTVAEGARNAEISYTTSPRTAPYKTWGRDDSLTKEAESQGRGYEDNRALSKASVLRRVMVDEEDVILGSNMTLALGVTPTPTAASAGTGGSLPAATYAVRCVALTYFGYQYATKTGNLAIPTFVGANAGKSGAASQAVGSGETLSVQVTPVNGAVAYAWYVGAAGSEKLEKITTINSATFNAALAGTGQAATAILTSDNSTDPNDFDGMLSQIMASGSGAYVKTLGTGTPGTGLTLTGDGAGGIVELDDMFQSLWDNARISPDLVLMNSQQMRDITKKVMDGSTGAYHIEVEGGEGQTSIMAGAAVASYVNKATGRTVKLEVHPTMTPGTLLALTFELPDWFPGNRPDGAWDLYMLDEYYTVEYGPTQRKTEHGVYARGVLRGYLPTCQGIIRNIAAG